MEKNTLVLLFRDLFRRFVKSSIVTTHRRVKRAVKKSTSYLIPLRGAPLQALWSPLSQCIATPDDRGRGLAQLLSGSIIVRVLSTLLRPATDRRPFAALWLMEFVSRPFRFPTICRRRPMVRARHG